MPRTLSLTLTHQSGTEFASSVFRTGILFSELKNYHCSHAKKESGISGERFPEVNWHHILSLNALLLPSALQASAPVRLHSNTEL